LNASIAGHTLADERQLIAFPVLRDSCSSQPAEVISRLHRGLSTRLPHSCFPGISYSALSATNYWRQDRPPALADHAVDHAVESRLSLPAPGR
jgi:hypothetical protein